MYFALTTPARLGLDLRGGTQIVLETNDAPNVKADAESTDRALEVLRRRIDALGVAEPTLARSGERRIIIELPGVQDPRQATEVIGRTAQLTFHHVRGIEGGPSRGDEPNTEGRSNGELVLPDESGQRLRLERAALTGDAVAGAEATLDQQLGSQWLVLVDFKGDGRREWTELTGEAACAPPGTPSRRIAIALDNRVISSPEVDPSVQCNAGISTPSTQITGQFTQQQAKDLAVLIEAGALPVPVEVIEQRTVGPTLGASAIEASAKAAVIGVILTGLFIACVYRLVGGLATVALAGYALMSYATLVALGATLTLPGLAGLVLAIGMAVDANVLVFERAREEYAEARGRARLRKALPAGFAKAWSAIVDSNVTTLLAAGLLFFLASGPVRGFGVTLSIGVLASMISALIVTRVLAEWAVGRRTVDRHPRISGLSTTGRVRDWLTRRDPYVMGRGRLWLALSACLVVVSVAGIAVRGPNFGVEFTGGRLIEYSTSRSVDADLARDAVSGAGFPRAVVQSSEGNISVRAGDLSNEEASRIESALEQRVGGDVRKQRDELIGPSLGDELRNKALLALAVALAVQLTYLAIRFRWTFALAVVLSMFQTVLIVVGAFAWLGKPIDGVFLAAVLTVIGYAVNDSVVVFDRIRERWGQERRKPLAQVANAAILQTVPRTVNTGIGALFILAALAILGGDSLTDFAIALLLGIIVGTCSTVFTAAPLAIELEGRSKTPPPQPKTAGTKPVRSARPAANPTTQEPSCNRRDCRESRGRAASRRPVRSGPNHWNRRENDHLHRCASSVREDSARAADLLCRAGERPARSRGRRAGR